MSDGAQTSSPYVKDPSLLKGPVQGSHRRPRRQQLMTWTLGNGRRSYWEISKTIERLEKAGVMVPDVLRGENTIGRISLPFMPTRRRHLS